MLQRVALKPKRCKVCKQRFVPSREMQPVCDYPSPCAIEWGQMAAERARRKRAAKAEREARAERVKTRQQVLDCKKLSYWADRAQAAVNAYVRWRDRNDSCISCNKPASWDGQWHASHFRSRGAASSLRFHLWNLHKACSECNHKKGGNIHGYYPKLVAKIGMERVDWLYSQNETKRYTREYLQRIERVFKRKLSRGMRG